MHTKKPVEPPDPNYAYEVRDLPIHSIAKAVFYFYVLVAVSAPLGALFMSWVGFHVGNPGPDHYELRHIPQAPNPLLQDGYTAHVDIANLRRKEDALLAGKAIDPTMGRPPVPIDQAIDEEAAKVDR